MEKLVCYATWDLEDIKILNIPFSAKWSFDRLEARKILSTLF